jgi:large-conductance mechanosensitive channel
MILIRYLLIGIAVFLIVRSFRSFGESTGHSEKIKESQAAKKTEGKKVSKSVGEYVDYEEIKK